MVDQQNIEPSARTPLKYYGGKQKLVGRLLPLLPKHDIYVEAFGGSGALLFAKQPARVEVFNDLDIEVVNFFRVLRTPSLALQLRHKLELTPYARQEHEDCRNAVDADDNPVERAWRFFLLIRQSRDGIVGGSWRYSKTSDGISPFYKSLDLLDQACRRLRNVYIENRDFERVVRVWDGPDTFVYLDPTYLAESRAAPSVYRRELCNEDHTRLLQMVVELQGKVILSGYASHIYDDALDKWTRIELRTKCWSTPIKSGNGSGAKADRTEVIWMNPAAIDAQNRGAVETLVSENKANTAANVSPA